MFEKTEIERKYRRNTFDCYLVPQKWTEPAFIKVKSADKNKPRTVNEKINNKKSKKTLGRIKRGAERDVGVRMYPLG